MLCLNKTIKTLSENYALGGIPDAEDGGESNFRIDTKLESAQSCLLIIINIKVCFKADQFQDAAKFDVRIEQF